jgi:hypothetical protein
MRREAIKVPSILGMHETPMSTRSMRMFRTIVQGRLDRGSLKTQICHGLGTGAVVANCEGNELPEKRTVAWPATGRLATSHVNLSSVLAAMAPLGWSDPTRSGFLPAPSHDISGTTASIAALAPRRCYHSAIILLH